MRLQIEWGKLSKGCPPLTKKLGNVETPPSIQACYFPCVPLCKEQDWKDFLLL